MSYLKNIRKSRKSRDPLDMRLVFIEVYNYLKNLSLSTATVISELRQLLKETIYILTIILTSTVRSLVPSMKNKAQMLFGLTFLVLLVLAIFYNTIALWTVVFLTPWLIFIIGGMIYFKVNTFVLKYSKSLYLLTLFFLTLSIIIYIG